MCGISLQDKCEAFKKDGGGCNRTASIKNTGCGYLCVQHCTKWFEGFLTNLSQGLRKDLEVVLSNNVPVGPLYQQVAIARAGVKWYVGAAAKAMPFGSQFLPEVSDVAKLSCDFMRTFPSVRIHVKISTWLEESAQRAAVPPNLPWQGDWQASAIQVDPVSRRQYVIFSFDDVWNATQP